MISIFSFKGNAEICNDFSFWNSQDRCTDLGFDGHIFKTYPISCDKSIDCSRTHSNIPRGNEDYCPRSSSLDQCKDKGIGYFFCKESETCIEKGEFFKI